VAYRGRPSQGAARSTGAVAAHGGARTAAGRIADMFDMLIIAVYFHGMRPAAGPTSTASTLEGESLTDRVERRLLESVHELGLSRGDALPHEEHLAERFGVSRGVVREALTRLQGLGFVERRRKRGTVLTEPDLFARLGRYMMPGMYSQASVKELFELRLALELGSVELVCENAESQHFEALEAIVAREAEARSIKALVACDVAFHSTLYEAAGNRSLERFQNLLAPFFQCVLQEERTTGRRTSPVGHPHLLRLLKRRDAERLRHALRRHLEPHWRRYRRSSKE